MANKDAYALKFENNYKGVSMEFLSHVAIVAGILLFVYSLVKMPTYKIPPTGLKGNNNLPNGNSLEKTSIENCNVKNGLEPKLDHYEKDIAIKSNITPNRALLGLAREKEFWIMINSHIAVDAEDNI